MEQDKLREEFPELTRIIDGWPDQDARGAVWQVARLAYNFGFGRGITHGLEQSAKIAGFAADGLVK